MGDRSNHRASCASDDPLARPGTRWSRRSQSLSANSRRTGVVRVRLWDAVEFVFC